MKNQNVLDFKLVVLHSEHTIWNALVHFVTVMEKSIDLKLQQKICTKAFHIVCSLRRTTNLKSNTI
jgi:hypothetical protein